MNAARKRHAIVVGAGICGLLAGRVLADHFERVTILDRDSLPEGPAPRRGVPQGRHLHSLAARGTQLLEEFFPGLDAELAEAGCPAVDQAGDAITDLPVGRLPCFGSGVVMRSASRGLLEWSIRRRLAQNGRISFYERREVTGLLCDPRSGEVTGVEVRTRRGPRETYRADLVVDASGQSSRAPRWLEAAGYSAPKEAVVDAQVGYATRWYRVPENFTQPWKSLAVLPGWPHSPRGGSLRQVEGGRWTVVLIGLGGDYPPTDEKEFARFAQSLPSPLIHDAIRSAEPVSPVYGYRRTANRRRHYERASLPRHFLVAGDAACFLNPSYGQGMTTAALSAKVLDRCLRERGRSDLGRTFHRLQAGTVAPAWRATVASDVQWSAGGDGGLNPARRFLRRLSIEVMGLATENREIARTLLEVKNLLAPPEALLRPHVLLPALRRSVFQARLTQRTHDKAVEA